MPQVSPHKSLLVRAIIRVCQAYLVLFHRFRREGACTIPATGPTIVVANHTTGLDPMILQVSSPHRIIHFMMAREYYNSRLLRPLCDRFGAIPVNRSGQDTASIRAALRVLRDGGCLGMFPEGKISLTGELLEGRLGVAMLVLQSGATVVPAYIHGTRPHKSMLKDFFTPARIRIRYGQPLPITLDETRARDPEARQQVTDQIMAAIAALRDQSK